MFFRYLILVIVLLLPFQDSIQLIVGQGDSIKWVSHIDEGLAVLLLMLFIISISWSSSRLFISGGKNLIVSLMLFLIVGLFSLYINDVHLGQGILGIYDYVKNIIIIYGLSVLRWKRNELKILVNGIIVLVVGLAISAVIGVVLSKFGHLYPVLVQEGEMRLGMYRASPFVGGGNANYLGMYALLALTLVIYCSDRRSYLQKTLSIILVLLTLSRQAWLGFVVLLMKLKRIYIFPVLIILSGAVWMAWLEHKTLLSQYSYFRLFAYLQALQIWVHNPSFGAGPGMFGGVISVLFGSPYYTEWPSYFQEYLLSARTIDAFWPSLLAELGVFGFVTYSLIFLNIYKALKSASNKAQLCGDIFLVKLGKALQLYILAIAIMCLFSGLNKAFVIFSFFTLCGIYFSVVRSIALRQAKT